MFHLRNRLGVNHCLKERKLIIYIYLFQDMKGHPGFLECFSLKVELIQPVMHSIRGYVSSSQLCCMFIWCWIVFT